jgi:hypothetical protein
MHACRHAQCEMACIPKVSPLVEEGNKEKTVGYGGNFPDISKVCALGIVAVDYRAGAVAVESWRTNQIKCSTI